MSNALRVHENDNVAVVTQTITRGNPVIVGGVRVCDTLEEIRFGHKVALAVIPTGGKVFRYGEAIVEATRNIAQGEWVHVHNTQPVPGTGS